MGDWRVVAEEGDRTEWAATLDALEQAPEGPADERETHPMREAAAERVRTWREAYAS